MLGALAFLGQTLGNLAQIGRDRRDRDRRGALDLALASQIEEIANSPDSGAPGDARLGTLEDARAAGLVDREDGLFLGFLDGRPLRYAGTSHLETHAPTRSGKSTDQILVNLGTVADRSLAYIDAKNGDLTWATYERRTALMGEPPVLFNPWRLFGLPTVSINILDRVVRKLEARSGYIGAAQGIAAMLVPIAQGARDVWPQQGAQELLVVVMVYLAHADRERCNLPEVYLLVVRGEAALVQMLGTIAKSDTPGGIPERAAGLLVTLQAKGGQWAAIAQELRVALTFVAPDEPCARCMRETTFDPAELKTRPMTFGVVSPAIELPGTAGKAQQVIVDCSLERGAEAEGLVRVTWLMDEFQNGGTYVGLAKALHMLGSQGIQLWLFIHHAEHLALKYSPEFPAAIASACEVSMAWNVEEEALARRIEYLAGVTTTRVVTQTATAGATGSVGWSVSEQTRPLLRADEIRRLGRGRMILRVTGQPYFVAERVPYYEIAETAGLRDPRTLTPSSTLRAPAAG